VKLGKRTAKLLREAIVLAYVEGHSHGLYSDPLDFNAKFPRDSEIVRTVLISATRLEDKFPTLARLEEARNADAEHRQAFTEMLKAYMASENRGEVQ
jgi:hypothetical protein